MALQSHFPASRLRPHSGRAWLILCALVCGGSGVLMPTVARAQAPGALVTSFNPHAGVALASRDLAQVDALLEQTDNKIVIAGNFDTYAGVAREGIARLNADGSLDKSFDPGTGALDLAANPSSGYVFGTALQSNQDILVAGSFTTFNGAATPGLVRLLPDGAVDFSFVPDLPADGSGAAVAVQENGDILVAYTQGASDLNYIIRLKPDGSRDASFAAALSVNNQINTIKILADGKILIGGFFTRVNGVKHSFLARLKANGSVDETFDSKIVSADSAQYGSVYIILVQPDGKIVVAGHFTSVGGKPRGSVARLDAGGGLDPSFDPGTGLAGYTTTTFGYSGALQPDGKIVIGGRFKSVDGITRSDIARLDADGALDPGFGLNGANYSVDAVLLQSNGDFIIGGYFTKYENKTRHGVARIY